VHGDIEQAITRQRQAAERVVDRERKRSHRAAVDRLVDRVGRQQPVRRPQAADIRVLDDRVDVVVNEVAVEAVGVDEAAGNQQQQRRRAGIGVVVGHREKVMRWGFLPAHH